MSRTHATCRRIRGAVSGRSSTRKHRRMIAEGRCSAMSVPSSTRSGWHRTAASPSRTRRHGARTGHSSSRGAPPERSCVGSTAGAGTAAVRAAPPAPLLGHAPTAAAPLERRELLHSAALDRRERLHSAEEPAGRAPRLRSAAGRRPLGAPARARGEVRRGQWPTGSRLGRGPTAAGTPRKRGPGGGAAGGGPAAAVRGGEGRPKNGAAWSCPASAAARAVAMKQRRELLWRPSSGGSCCGAGAAARAVACAPFAARRVHRQEGERARKDGVRESMWSREGGGQAGNERGEGSSCVPFWMLVRRARAVPWHPGQKRNSARVRRFVFETPHGYGDSFLKLRTGTEIRF